MPLTLLYHDVTSAGADDSSGFPGPGAARYKLTTGEFDRHLARLTECVRRRPAVLDNASEFDRGSWMITFDDGGSSSLAIADALEDRGWRGWFFMTTNCLGAATFLDNAGLRELHQRGHRIGTHSCSHPTRFSYCPASVQLAEWRQSRARLEDVLGSAIVTGSVPGGYYNRDVARIAADAGVSLLFTSEPTTRVASVPGCDVIGRYTIYRGMTDRDASGLLTSSWSRGRQSWAWAAKKAAKQLGGEAYLKFRERYLRRNHVPSMASVTPG